MVFAAHVEGDTVRFELRGEYTAKERSLWRATVLDRIEKTAKYLAVQMDANLTRPPTEAEAKRRAAIVHVPVATEPVEGDVADPDATPAPAAPTDLFAVDTNAAPLEKKASKDWKLPVAAGAVAGLILGFALRLLRRRKKAS